MITLRDWSMGNRFALGIAATITIVVGVRLHAMGRVASDGDVAIAERIVLPDPFSASGLADDSLARLVAAAVSVDPFQPGRTRPATRFHPRGATDGATATDSASSAPAPAAPQAAPAMALQGIAHLPNGGALAVLSARGGTAQLLRIGQSIDDYRLSRVDSSSVTLVGTDSTIILHLRDVARTAP
jgi:hypothetical protein